MLMSLRKFRQRRQDLAGSPRRSDAVPAVERCGIRLLLRQYRVRAGGTAVVSSGCMSEWSENRFGVGFDAFFDDWDVAGKYV